MALLITNIVGDLRNVFLKAQAIASFLFFAFYDLSSISPHYDEATVLSVLSIPFSLLSPLFYFLPGFFFGLGSLLGLVSFILELGGYTGFLGPFKLIIPEIEAHFHGSFPFGAPLI